MRLTGIRLAGFKSFVDPTVLPLPSNLTAVVGPNGCGKSNIIDAVRWVLGESSMKQLRGQDSEDVIFNGSKSRKPVGRASVELTFDNSDAGAQGPYAAYTDIAVKRELTRDGHSQYFLNGRKCLKRDVTDLFLGTGLGGRNQYAIIEQGMVSRMVEARPEELRVWLEEAAGISKYKERRRETESRIHQTRENLTRINDLRSELQQRLEVLQRQAANAEKYREFKQQERVVRAQIFVLRERALAQQAATHQQLIAERAAGAEATRTAVAEAEDARVQAEEALRERQATLTEAQSEVYEAESRQARAAQGLQHAEAMRAARQRELDQVQRQLAELERRQQSERQRLDNLRREIARLEQQNAHADEAEAQARRLLAEAEDEQSAREDAWESFQQGAEQPLFETEGQRVRLQALERAQLELDERHKRLSAERAGLNPEAVAQSLAEADTELERLADESEAEQLQLQLLDAALAQARDRRTGLERQLHEARQLLQTARGKLSSLETLQQAALRQDDAELERWLRERRLTGRPRLAQVIEVDAGWERAVEHVLDAMLQAPVVPSLAEHAEAAAPRAGIALVECGTDAATPCPQSLAARVRGPAALSGLLAGIRCAGPTEPADAQLRSLPLGESLITADGVWRGRDWLRHPRRDAGHGGMIVRAQQIRQLRGQVEEIAARAAAGEGELAALRAGQQRQEAERREIARRLEQHRARHAQRLAFRQAQAVRLEQMQARAQALQQDLDALGMQREQQRDELESTRARLGELEAQAQRLREQRLALQQHLAQARERVARARGQLAQTSQSRSALQLQLASRTSAVQAVEQGFGELEILRENLLAEREARARECGDFEAPIAEQAEALQAAAFYVTRRREALRRAREALGQAEQQLGGIAQRQRQAEQEKDAAQERLQQARLEYENLRTRREGFAQQFQDACSEGELSREAVLAELPADAAAEAWDERLAQLQRRIDRLGAINLAAIQELEQAQTREQYLGAQHADLAGALDTLEEAMRKLDAETQERFRATFDYVDGIFRDRFPRLFGGGEAYLELSGSDLLETGVRVMARPPGKRNSSIQMLSGGEKAMTAVALLLALFQLNPAPFCLMDEVDAPLDDANVGRFCEVVREMAQNVQFIIITHNKITMELASHLHGVTMQEPGVSRLVSVDVQQAVALAGRNDGKE